MSVHETNVTIVTTPTITAAKAIADFLPTFDRDSYQLESFIHRCDKFHNTYGKTNDNSLNDFVFNVICSKLKSDVSNFLMCRPDLTDWPQVKTALREHLGDKIDRQTLTREFLQLTKYRNETILDFLDRLKQLKSRIEVKIQTDAVLTQSQKTLLINQNELNALDVLAANSDDKLRLLLDLKQPGDLSEARDLIPMQPKILNFQQPPPQFQSNQSLIQRPKFPSQPIPIQPRQVTRTYPTNWQVIGKPINVFAPKNSHKPTGPPEPMSITSKNPSIKQPSMQRNFFRTSGPSNFISEELYNTETQLESEDNTSLDPFYTGCHCSMLRPYIAEKYFPDTIFRKRTPIPTCAETKFSHFKAKIPLLEEFNISDSFKFILFPFHDYFDGILGLGDLRRLGLTMNLQTQRLCNKRLEIPFSYRTDFQTQKAEIPPESIVVKEIKTSLPDNVEIITKDIICSQNSVEFPACITKVENQVAKIEIKNPTKQTQIVNLNFDFLKQYGPPFDPDNFGCYHVEDMITRSDVHDDNSISIDDLQIDHLNSEEKTALEKLLDFRNPIEITNKEQLPNYVTEHTRLIEIMSNQLYDKLDKKQRQNLERENRHRKRSIEINTEKPLYTKEFGNRAQKDKSLFTKINNPKIVGDNKILSNNKITHQRQLKSKRKLIVPGPQDELDEHSSNSAYDDTPLSKRLQSIIRSYYYN
ncbi:hypothetical protein ILUMI_24881 [Ignelater luminosus]|uniref:Retrotransposon gag domain-containing protein n=1 Tax=Ignelater luminosus TaxID=2038154 RepID=A0A8K0G0G9_IGNLU|nr:hypothetical protein ILUMI_24881 [Ignelater luminosus]